MSKGSPDYYNVIDIGLQTLGQIINRPKYGGASKVSGTTAVAANVETEILSVSGTGMIYGGHIVTNPAATQKNSLPRIYIDDNLLTGWSWKGLDDNALIDRYSNAVYKLKYDDTGFFYVAGVGYGFTFESSFAIKYFEKHGDTPTVQSDMLYALV